MYEVSSGQRSSEIEVIDLHEIDAADVHSGKLTLRCKQGHTTEVKLPVPEFELLFDLGCSALLDGYPREAVTSFAASFERFEEITCRFLFGRRHLSFERVDHWWKEVATSSERQKGSFVALWIASFFEEPPTLPRKLIELRNDCVHKGRIPRESEAKAYGEAGRRHHRHGAGRAGRARRLHAPDLSRRARHCRHALPQAAYDTRTAFAPVGLITEAP
jgi:hypothetical protein